jgi:thiol-disulfide isomerase/thioredoxin
MKKLWKPILIILVAAVMIVDIILDNRATAQNPVIVSRSELDLPVGTAIGQLAPDFSGSTADGEMFQLSDLRGKTVLVNVFASWCGPCIAETPHLVEVYNQGRDDGLEIVGLNLQESPEAVTKFQDEFDIEYPLVLNEDGFLTNNIYKPIGLPTTWFIDQDGVVRYVFSGPMNQQVLQQVIDDVAAGRDPDPFAGT